ncbi:MAG: arginase family protein [Actinomycetota bacterium]|nr:arginase family protein [Actinomycetota bacterium]MDH5314659.1 arginase family protein [Actinomycetota bacterium]
MTGVTLFGVPIDCVGEPVGTVRSPGVLRGNGVVEALGARDLGDLDVVLGPSERDPVTGIVGSDSVLDLTRTVRTATADALTDRGRLVVLGGCCTLQVGAMAGVRARFPEARLVFLDGHMDLYDGVNSLGGEAADMPVAVLLGLGPEAWGEVVDAPVLAPGDIALIGFRDLEEARDLGSVTPEDLPGLTAIDTEGVRTRGIEATIAEATPPDDRRYWVFTDVDVLDPSELTVDAPQPDGLTWVELTALLTPLVHDPRCLGITLACYNPDLDADGAGARKVVELLATVVPD